jgi:hypothetical protein
MIISHFQLIWQNNNRFEKGTTSATLFWSRRGHECPTSPGTSLSRTEPCAWIPLLKSLVWWTPGHAPREVCPGLSFTAQEWPTVTRVHSAHCWAEEKTRRALSPSFPEQDNCILDPLLFTAPVQSVHVDSTMGLHWSTVNQIFLNLQHHETCLAYTTKDILSFPVLLNLPCFMALCPYIKLALLDVLGFEPLQHQGNCRCAKKSSLRRDPEYSVSQCITVYPTGAEKACC